VSEMPLSEHPQGKFTESEPLVRFKWHF